MRVTESVSLDSPSCSHVLKTCVKSTEHSPTIFGSFASSAQTCTCTLLFTGILLFAPPTISLLLPEAAMFPEEEEIMEDVELARGLTGREGESLAVGRVRMSSASSKILKRISSSNSGCCPPLCHIISYAYNETPSSTRNTHFFTTFVFLVSDRYLSTTYGLCFPILLLSGRFFCKPVAYQLEEVYNGEGAHSPL